MNSMSILNSVSFLINYIKVSAATLSVSSIISLMLTLPLTAANQGDALLNQTRSNEIASAVIAIVVFALSVLMLFWGKKLLHLILFIFGFSAGLVLANIVNSFIFRLSGMSMLIFYLVLAIACAVIMAIALSLSFFLAGNFVGYIAINSVSALLPPVLQQSWFTLVACLLFGILGVILKEQVIAVFAAFVGSLLLLDVLFSIIFSAAPLTFLKNGFKILDSATALIACILLLALTIIGALYQLGKIKLRA